MRVYVHQLVHDKVLLASTVLKFVAAERGVRDNVVFPTLVGRKPWHAYITTLKPDLQYKQRWAFLIELRYSDNIGIRKINRDIGLAKLSDFKYWTNKTGLPIV